MLTKCLHMTEEIKEQNPGTNTVFSQQRSGGATTRSLQLQSKLLIGPLIPSIRKNAQSLPIGNTSKPVGWEQRLGEIIEIICNIKNCFKKTKSIKNEWI